ncbi:lipase family protein [Rhodococcus olei]|uniref:Lipase family protein n=1 Tax=Rhodococcus olei TaxID=2161675 RepID=A0ABP8P559_9NOCA
MALDPLDPTSAVVLGPFIDAAYGQFRVHESDVSPAAIPLPTGYSLVRNIQMRDFLVGEEAPRFYGYLAAGPAMQVIALRGTATITEWFDDLHWDSTRFTPAANAGNVVAGFFGIYRTMTTTEPGQTAATPGIAGLVAAVDPALPLVVTGHSLGAALSTMLVVDLAANSALRPQAWTFASPKVGDSAFVARYTALTTVSWRIYNVVDIVTLFPVNSEDPYQDVPTGHRIDSAGYARWDFGCAHAMNTYLHGLDPAIALDPACVR